MGLETFREAIARSHNTHARSIEIFLDNSIMLPRDALEEAQEAELRSESYTLIKRLLELAHQYCDDQGLEPGSEEALAAFEEAYTTATSITYAYPGLPFSMDERKALSPDHVTEKLRLLVPSYVTSLATYVKNRGKLGVLQDDLSQAVGKYVKGRFKSPTIDRVLAQALTQAEIVAYMDEMLQKDPFTGMSKLEEISSPSVVKAVWNISKLIFVLWLVCFGIAALPFVFSVLPASTVLFASFGLGVLGTIAMLVILVLGIMTIIGERPRRRKLQNSAVDIIKRMNGFFLEFKSTGPFSTAHLRKRVDELVEVGVIWPSGIFVLLDDMEMRGVRTF